MRVLVLGGDGFCGWPTSLYLSDSGHDVTILDNLSRRKIDIELEVESLTPIQPIGQRLRAWKEVSGREIGFVSLDIATEYDRLVEVLRDKQPDAIVHFAVTDVPMGGIKESGIGRRHGAEGIRKFCYQKSIVVDRFGLKSEINWFPNTPAKLSGLKRVMNLLYRSSWRRKIFG